MEAFGCLLSNPAPMGKINANFPLHASTDMQKAILYTVTAACAGYWSGFVRKEIERFLGTVPCPLS